MSVLSHLSGPTRSVEAIMGCIDTGPFLHNASFSSDENSSISIEGQMTILHHARIPLTLATVLLYPFEFLRPRRFNRGGTSEFQFLATLELKEQCCRSGYEYLKNEPEVIVSHVPLMYTGKLC